MSGKIVPLPAGKKKPSAVRGPHAERSAAMRQRLIDAAIHCLHAFGYAATTTQLVVETAKVSRGAILHHFPTKVDLMLAVAEYAAGKQNRHVRRFLAETPEGIERYIAITDATWSAMSQPAAQALLEIMMASRSDPELSDRLVPVVASLEQFQREGVWELAQELGIKHRDTVLAMVRLHVAAMRGIAIELNLTGDAKAAEESMRLLNHYKRRLTGELLAAPADKPFDL